MPNPKEHRKQKRLSRSRWLKGLSRKGKMYDPESKIRTDKSYGPEGYRSTILDLLFKLPSRSYKRIPLKPRTFSVPSSFSLSKGTEAVLTLSKALATYARKARAPRITVDHRAVKHLGLAAETFLAIVLKEISLESRHRARYSLQGFKPLNESAKRILDEIGCARIIQEQNDTLEVSLRSDTKVYRYFNKAYEDHVDPMSTNKIGQTVTKFSDHLDSCLSLVGKKLSASGRDNLLAYVSEILENAQEHSGTATWVIIGYIDENDQRPTYRCVILSLGMTISESFRKLPSTSFAWRQVEPYVKIHRKKKFFSPQWTEDTLLTIVALQEAISSKNTSKQTDRGQGTVELIDFFQKMAIKCSSQLSSCKMALLSGSTIVHFLPEYPMRYSDTFDRKIIAFNRTNDLFLPPDSSCVMVNEGIKFPGTAISIVVPLSSSSIVETSSG